MSKVARSARVASRQRVETITADKTITSAETGETYLIDWNSASAIEWKLLLQVRKILQVQKLVKHI